MNDDVTQNMLGIIPPIVLGGALMLLTERFINKPFQTQRKKAKRFDEVEYKDLKGKTRRLGSGDFSNIGW